MTESGHRTALSQLHTQPDSVLRQSLWDFKFKRNNQDERENEQVIVVLEAQLNGFQRD